MNIGMRTQKSCMVRAMGIGVIALGLSAGAISLSVAADKYATAKELKLMEGFPPPPDKRVTKANALQNAPYHRWSYQHMRMFFPSANVPAADVPVRLSKTIDWKFERGVKVKS